MITRSTVQHLRFPFSLFLLPIFLFAVSQAPEIQSANLMVTFIILHLLVYPASNGFNSYYDRDEASIGSLKHPPEVTPELLYVSLGLDAIALLLSLLIDWRFCLMILLYGVVSKFYSHPAIRLKSYPVIGWVTAVVFQGAYTYLITSYVISSVPISSLFDARFLLPAACGSLLLGGFYPLTQVYQHAEDARRGDITISLRLGVRGTFLFVAGMFLLADLCLLFYFWRNASIRVFLIMQMFLLPAFVYFGWWSSKVFRDTSAVDFTSTMRMNLLSSIPLNIFFLLLSLQVF